MPQAEYLVKARARNGRLVESRMAAQSESDAIARVKGLGLTPIAVDRANVGLKREIRFGRGRVTTKDLAVVSRQFATMLAAGLPILRCLAILEEQVTSRRLGEILGQVRRAVEEGSPLSDALGEHREIPLVMVSMVRAGEVGGFLDATLVQVAESLEADVKLRSRIKSALTYPVAVAVIAVIITTGMLLFVVPVFAGLFASFGGELPLPTRILVGVSDTLRNPFVLLPLITAIVVGTVLYRRNRRSERIRRIVEPLRFRLPVFGPLFAKVALARFTRNLSSLLGAGVPILSALDVVAETAGNVVIADAVAAVKESVRQGSGMARPLAKHPIFPDMVVHMIAVGEDAGALDTMLGKVADFYDQEVEATTEQLMALIEPVMILGLGAIVGGMIIAMYLPIFKIFDLVK